MNWKQTDLFEQADDGSMRRIWVSDTIDIPACEHGIDILAPCDDCENDVAALPNETPLQYAARRLRELDEQKAK